MLFGSRTSQHGLSRSNYQSKCVMRNFASYDNSPTSDVRNAKWQMRKMETHTPMKAILQQKHEICERDLKLIEKRA